MRAIAVCCLALIAALWIVGIEASQPVRHLVQTSPIWIAVALALRGDSSGKWVALAFFVFWALVMASIWLFLLGWAQLVSGRFTHLEIVLTVCIGAVSLAGAVACLRFKGVTGWVAGIGLFLVAAAIQLAALRLSMLPSLAHR